MKPNWKLLLLVPVFLALQACVVVVGTDAEDGVDWGGNDREINGIQHDGDRLSKDVARAIAADEELVAEDVRISSEDHVVVLKGRVRSVALLERLLDAARAVEGVERVVSKMTVDAG